MKIRNGFVSNSSSSSFVIQNEVYKDLYCPHCHKDGNFEVVSDKFDMKCKCGELFNYDDFLTIVDIRKIKLLKVLN
jgi:hypothetical protein